MYMPDVIFYFVYPNIIATDTPAIINNIAIVNIHPNGLIPSCFFIIFTPLFIYVDNFTYYYFIYFIQKVNRFSKFVIYLYFL